MELRHTSTRSALRRRIRHRLLGLLLVWLLPALLVVTFAYVVTRRG